MELSRRKDGAVRRRTASRCSDWEKKKWMCSKAQLHLSQMESMETF